MLFACGVSNVLPIPEVLYDLLMALYMILIRVIRGDTISEQFSNLTAGEWFIVSKLLTTVKRVALYFWR